MEAYRDCQSDLNDKEYSIGTVIYKRAYIAIQLRNMIFARESRGVT